MWEMEDKIADVNKSCYVVIIEFYRHDWFVNDFHVAKVQKGYMHNLIWNHYKDIRRMVYNDYWCMKNMTSIPSAELCCPQVSIILIELLISPLEP